MASPEILTADDIAARLRTFIGDQTGKYAEVSDLERIPGGFSFETWSLQARWEGDRGEREARVVMRRAPRGGVLEPYDASKEFRVLKALEGSAVPAPRALWCDPSGDILGTSFYVMEFVGGKIPLPWDESITGDTKTSMHEQFTDTLAAMHTLDWESLGLDFLGVPKDRDDPAALELDRCREILDRVSLRPYPLLWEVIAWLDERRPKSPVLSLIHNDYRMGNFIWDGSRIVAFLDWERAFIGDPMVDVAFSRLPELAGWCTIAGPMAERYTQRSGIEIDEERVQFYLILEQLKATLVGLTGMRAFADGRTSDARLVQIGRVGHQAFGALAKQIGLGQ